MSVWHKCVCRFNDPAGSDFKFRFPDGKEILLHQCVFKTKYFKIQFKYSDTVINNGEHFVMDATKNLKYETVYPICQSFYGLEPLFQFPKDIVMAVDYLLSFAFCVEEWKIQSNNILVKFFHEFQQFYKPEKTPFNQIFIQLDEVVKHNSYELMFQLVKTIYKFILDNPKHIPAQVFGWKYFGKFDSNLVITSIPFIKSVTEEEFDHLSKSVNCITESKFSECEWKEQVYLSVTRLNPFKGYMFEKIGNIDGIAKHMGQKPQDGERYGICVDFDEYKCNFNDTWTVSGKEIVVHSYMNMFFGIGRWYYLEETGVYPLRYQNIYKKTPFGS